MSPLGGQRILAVFERVGVPAKALQAFRGVEMVLVRSVFHAQFGKGGELAAEFKKVAAQMNAEMGSSVRWRVLTDLSGPFDTVVQEIEFASLAEWEQSRAKLFQSATFRESSGRIQALTVDGCNELWTVEGQG